jgi:hypothetical protein
MWSRLMFAIGTTTIISTVLFGCGLDMIRGTLVAIEGDMYIVRDADGQERRVRADDSTRKDDVEPGDQVRVYATEDGYMTNIQKLNGEQGGAGLGARPPHRKARD